jgi:hypothetical protein
MRLLSGAVLALDYDGTIAQDGVLDPEVQQAVHEAQTYGVTVVLVTGRSLCPSPIVTCDHSGRKAHGLSPKRS